MCTVTYIPNKTGFLVTDNRDESVNRPADAPKCYAEYTTHLFYPKDKTGGGTWMGLSRKKRLICLMNGAFTKYKRQPPYLKSRGIVVKELLAADNLTKTIQDYHFKGIEPFFALIFDWSIQREVSELVWDGLQIHLQEKDANRPAIWSSAMSYSKEEHAIKEKRFTALIRHSENIPLAEDLWRFHHTKESEEAGGLVINRGILRTTSVSQFQLNSAGRLSFRFHDLLSDQETSSEVIWP